MLDKKFVKQLTAPLLTLLIYFNQTVLLCCLWNEPTSSTVARRTGVTTVSGLRLTNESAGRVFEVDDATRVRVDDALTKHSLSFEVNHGQASSEARFLSRTNDYTLFLNSSEAVLRLRSWRDPLGPHLQQTKGSTKNILRMKMVGADPKPFIEGLDPLPRRSNYLIGNDPDKWLTNIKHFGRVKYHDVYPEVDLIYHSSRGRLEYDFVVAPGADPSVIRFAFQGMNRISIDAQGSLVIDMPSGVIRQQRPFIYQEVDGIRKEVAGQFVIAGKREVGFRIGEYDASLGLVIDPVLSYSTYLGGENADEAKDIAVDFAGNIYVTGWTDSINFPTTPAALPNDPRGGEAFVTKINPSLPGDSSLIYSTYLGGSGLDRGHSIAVDRDGNACVTGLTTSPDFPTENAFDSALGANAASDQDAFVTKLNRAGTGLLYSTYLGGSEPETGEGIALDGSSSIYATGRTNSDDFPTKNSSLTYRGGVDTFVTRIDPSKSGPASLTCSTYLGGSSFDEGNDIAVDGAGYVYVTGETQSADFPTEPDPGALQTEFGGGIEFDAFITKFHPMDNGQRQASGQGDSMGEASVVFSTYLGRSLRDSGLGIAADSEGNAYVTGETISADFNATAGGFQPSKGSGEFFEDAFVAKINPTGTALIYFTYLGGSNRDMGKSIAVDPSGNAYVSGDTRSSDFPLRNPIQAAIGSGFFFNAFVAKLNPTGSALVYSTYLGGRGQDQSAGIAIDSNGSAYVVGQAGSNDFPIIPGALQTSRRENFDGFIVRIDSLDGSAAAGGLRIESASVVGNKLIIFGEGFDGGAVILINGERQKTRSNGRNPDMLISKKAGQRIRPGSTVTLMVRNSDDKMSPAFSFTRPLE